MKGVPDICFERNPLDRRMEVVPPQAMRANAGKPELCYLLTFKGAFFESTPLNALSEWYRGERDDIQAVATAALETLRPDWPELLARVCMFGEKKYARGNYLLGRKWSDTCNSLLRHSFAKERGEGVDPESGIEHDGHIAWNLLFLVHCVLTMPQFDDRIRPPRPEPKPYAHRKDLPEHEREISAEALRMLDEGIAAVRAGQVEPEQTP